MSREHVQHSRSPCAAQTDEQTLSHEANEANPSRVGPTRVGKVGPNQTVNAIRGRAETRPGLRSLARQALGNPVEPRRHEHYRSVVIDISTARLGAEAARRLQQADCCEIEPGLSDDEFERIEAEYGFQFSDDHRAFLAAGLPVSEPPQEGASWAKPWPD